MQTADNIDNYNSDPVVKNLSTVAATAFKELEMANYDLREKESQLKEIAEISSSKINAAAKVNSDLQGKISLLQDLSTRLEEQNQDLNRRNEELKIKEKTYHNLNQELRGELEKVTIKQKELAIKESYLEKLVEQKTKEVSKAEKMATIGELTSRLAHDLRNPLSVIKTTHGIMKDKPNMKIDERLQYHSRIDRAILRIVHLVDDVLDFVRVSALSLESFSITSILDSAIDSIDIPSDVKIKRPTKDITISCDFRKMEAVFANLLTNSIQAVNNVGAIEIKISQKDGLGIIEIEDDGPGISDSVISQIFDPLFTTKSFGTGLGLSICKSIIEQHGGSISVSSNPTVFKIMLPLSR
jgi:two-component system sensor histidine kinase HydH